MSEPDAGRGPALPDAGCGPASPDDVARVPAGRPVAGGSGTGPGTDDTAHRADELEVGVGPWPGEWPRDPRYDPELLARGDRRNVVDAYRYWRLEAIVADLDTRRHPFHVAIENWAHDLNIGSIVRTANAFLAAEVHIVGRRRWNRRGAMVTDRYQHVRHHPDVADLVAWAATAGPDGAALPLIGIDNVPGSVPLDGYPLPRACVLVLGQESRGLSPEAIAACEAVLHVRQFGSTRSINAGAAGAITLHAWVARHVPLG